MREIKRKKKILKAVKILKILGLAIFVIAFFEIAGISPAQAAAPGYQNPGSRVPPSTVVAPKPKPAPKKPAPKPAPVAKKPVVVVANPLDDAKFLLDNGLYTRAKPYLLRAVKEQPRNPYSFYYLGLCYEKMGDFANAQKYYTLAVEIDRQFPILSRVVVYPDDPHGKIPLWDPRRGARIQQIEPVGESLVVERKDTSPPNPRGGFPLSINGEGEQSPLVPVYVPPDYVEVLEMEEFE